MNKIAILLTCHNRRQKTISALKSLFDATLPEGCDISTFLVDDGSTDGTGDAVRTEFPQVNVIAGNGKLFWNGGMYLAWERAVQAEDFGFYLWMNDDVILYKDALVTMFASYNKTGSNSIVCGAFCSHRGDFTYGGHNKNGCVVLDGTIKEVLFANGNFLLIPKEVFLKIGQLDPSFCHSIGDFDYGLRAIKAGVKVYSTGQYVGICEKTGFYPKMFDPKYKLKKRFHFLYSHLGCPPPLFFRYNLRHKGLMQAVLLFVSSHLHCAFPRVWPCKRGKNGV